MAKTLTSKEIERAAARNGFELKDCKGNHRKVKAPDGSCMIYYYGEISNGVSCKIRKWFLRFGVLLVLALMIYASWIGWL